MNLLDTNVYARVTTNRSSVDTIHWHDTVHHWPGRHAYRSVEFQLLHDIRMSKPVICLIRSHLLRVYFVSVSLDVDLHVLAVQFGWKHLDSPSPVPRPSPK